MFAMVRFTAIATLLTLIFISLFDLRAAFLARSAKADWLQVADSVSRRDARTGSAAIIWSAQASKASQQLEAAASVWGAPQEIHELSARALRLEAEQEVKLDRRIALYCRSLAQLGEAVSISPYDVDLLVSWASTRQLLGSTPCPSGITEGDFRRVVKLALETAPHDSSAIFSAALVSLWGQDRPTALMLFSRLLNSGYQLTSGQQGIVLREFKSGQDFSTVVPHRFPQIVQWSKWIKDRRPEAFETWKTDIAKMQRESLRHAVEDFKTGVAPAELHLERMLQLYRVAAHDEIRGEIDHAMSRFYDVANKDSLARFYEMRSTLSRKQIVPGVLVGDTRPKTASLVQWGERQDLVFDDFFNSAGFFLPRGGNPRLIELRSSSPSSEIDPTMITIYASADNLVWEELKPKSTGLVNIEGLPAVTIALPRHDALYWKVHFESSAHVRSFSGEVGEMLRIYGE